MYPRANQIMPILEYSGKFGLNGQVVDGTTVKWSCPACGRESSTRYGSYKNHKDMCAFCQRFGKPRTEAEVKMEYPKIQSVKTFDKRGSVCYNSLVDIVCDKCGNVFETMFRHVKTCKHRWNCMSCGHIKNAREILLPSQLPEYIKGVNPETLGSLGRVIAQTEVFLNCPRCGEEQKRPWRNVQRLGQTMCKSCVTGTRWEDDKYRQAYSKMISDKWKTEEYRSSVLVNRKDNGYLSGLHRDVKLALLAYGITSFQSEQIIGDYRVDEVDFVAMVALEIHGDYWHCNPSIYPPDYKSSQMVSAKERWDEDAKRMFALRMMGYRPYVIWEKDFYGNPVETISNFHDWLVSIEQNTIDALNEPQGETL